MDLQEAIKRSIQTEKNAMDFYRLAATHMKDADAKRVFEVLARDEKEHAGQFFAIYKGSEINSFDDFIATPPKEESDWMADLRKMLNADFNERQAMELAMKKEQQLEKALREMAAKVDDPQVRQVYEDNAKSTNHHYQVIESEYARLMGMVHETDIDTFVRE
ncbi:ferritin family protein [Desulfuromonas sp. AOP6]|uniref:ferritin-like domain-containing protein n=1 Tax=Desulfuromonas sp. AOP6 TaxID=1566351 RepID=UPI00127AD68E|nr:ferritin family protein [Desulfuromonas sp. AOP6]BCA80703.1 ferritin [Desulfuromonas sp. AOP6]